ncbi:MAG: DNA topoisomerase 4 subunit A [Clostridia bacterium]|nr:DNA topoisomerase 4 subunit A [Clostridia bacterium]
MEENKKSNVIVSSIEEVLHSSMIPYAEYVILDRALPRVEDGLKPVQRRILYAMHDLGLTPDKPYKKSARVVGECLAKYHPHGDTSVYDAMVRLAQPFNMRMKLVDGQGNFGSVDGDGAAAMRYTEAKLNSLALEMLRDLDKDTVDWENNFDDTLKEPVTLPCRYPNVLVNGAMGIAVGLATNIPPHNLAEVVDGAIAVIENPRISLDDMMKIVIGPDFPTGGYIIAGDELKTAYETGRGKILIRSKIDVETEKSGRQNIVVTEIPYQVNKAALISKIGQLMVDRKDEFGCIMDVVDESDRHGMRVVIKLRKDTDVSLILELLYKNTNLQVSYGINMVMIADGKPQQLGLIPVLKYYTDYQKQVVLRRTKYDLSKAKARYEIVTGLIIAVTNIDKVIQIIKKSPDTPTARQNLRKEFDLSEVQAQAILDLKLARLTRLEIDNLKDELESLKQLIQSLQEIIDSKRKLNALVVSELKEIKKKYKDGRKSVIVRDGKEIDPSPSTKGGNGERAVETFALGVSAKGYVKKIKYPVFKKSTSSEPTPAEIFTAYAKVKSDNYAYAFTNKGNLFKINPDNVPEGRGMTQGGITFDGLFKDVQKGEKIVSIFAFETEPQGKFIVFTKQGFVKITEWSDCGITRTSCQAIKLKDGDEVLSVEQDVDGKDMFFVTAKGMCLRAEKDVPVQGRIAGGVKGINLTGDDTVISASLIDDDLTTECVIVTSFGTFKKVITGIITKTARACKGVKIAELGDPKMNECVVYASCVSPDEKSLLTVVDRIGAIYYVYTSDIPQDGRTTKGRTLSGVGACQPLVVYCVRR